MEAVTPSFRRLFHWGPLVAIFVISQISTATIYCHFLWWPPTRSLPAFCHLCLFFLWTYLTLNYLIDAASRGPGLVSLGWKPCNIEDARFLQYCSHCEGYKAPRSHHCRKCNRCVMKMDHHCPWINNCCGLKNQASFSKFLLSAVCGCMQAVFTLGPSIYRAVFRVWYLLYGTGKEPIVELGLYGIVYAIFAFGLAVGVILSVGFLFIVQMRSILRNKTGIEEYIVTKARAHRRKNDTPFVFPYDLGWKDNFLHVFGWSCASNQDGIFYPVVEGCDQYTLTREQLRQKRVKRSNAVQYVIVRDFGGGVCAFQFGFRVFCCQPWSEEPRIAIKQGDVFLVTRWHRYWLYGEKDNVISESAEDKVIPLRGWFPRKCARNLDDITEPHLDENHEKDQ